MADPPSNKVEPHGTSVNHPDGGAGATGGFMAQHKTMLIIIGVAVGGLGLVYFLTQNNSSTGTAAANAATGTSAGSQDAGTATALTDLQTQFNALQQLLAGGNGTINGANPPIGDPIPLPAPGGPNQVFCQVGYYRGGDGNCYAIIPTPPVPTPGLPPPVIGGPAPGPIDTCPAGSIGIYPFCVSIPTVLTPGGGGTGGPLKGFIPSKSGISGYEANGQSFFYNNGSLQSVGTLGSTSNIASAVAPAGWKPAASGVSGYESNGYAAYFNNGSLQSVSKLGQR